LFSKGYITTPIPNDDNTYFSGERKKSVKVKMPQLFSYFGKKKTMREKKKK
jgi:hypothetical protein